MNKTLIKLAILFLIVSSSAKSDFQTSKLLEGWDFRYKGFIIGAWWSPGADDLELNLYKEAGFNVLIMSQYMNDMSDIDKAIIKLDYARKYNLWVMFDTLTKNEEPWGGKKWVEPYENPFEHRASLEELKFLYDAVANHPAMLGFLLGDDQGEITPRTKACTDFLYQRPQPQLIPWLCGWIPPKNLAKFNNPFSNPQIYPPLNEWHLPSDMLAIKYISEYAKWSSECKKYGLVFWPMFYVQGLPGTKYTFFPSDSLIRFPAYLAIAFGAKGIWYFHYGGSAFQNSLLKEESMDDRTKSCNYTPLYTIAKEVNNRIAFWGDYIVSRESTAIFSTAFPENPEMKKIKGLKKPGIGSVIDAMDKYLIVGILEKKGENALAMVVDCRISKEWEDIPYREVSIYFSHRFKTIKILDCDQIKEIKGNGVKFNLKAGEGQLLELTR